MNQSINIFMINFSAFIYTMPGYNCSIKDRMLYASSKNAVVEVLENDGIEIIKKVCSKIFLNLL